ncbi:MAG: hypothetical protein C4576_07075 [Desulfobacteraceae bacterium]|nr:MAG: hypothetical protein C4576_07075 [Desulfobacteraceae bacterium]
MKTARRILLLLSLFILICLLFAGGILAYLHRHPEKVKGAAEEFLSGAIGADFTIGALSYSLSPLALSARNIHIRSREPASGFHLEVPSLRAEMVLQGPPGRRTLVITELSLPELSFNLSGKSDPPGFDFPSGPPSLSSRIAAGLISLIFFRDIELEHGSIGDGSGLIGFEGGSLKLSRIRGEFSAAEPPQVLFHAELRLADGSRADFPNFRIAGPRTFSLSDPVEGTLFFDEGRLNLPAVEAFSVSGRGNFTSESLKSIVLDSIEVTASPVVLSLGGQKIRVEEAGLSSSQGILHPTEGVVSFPQITLRSSFIREMRLGLSMDEKETLVTISAEKVGASEQLRTLGLIPGGWEFSGEDGLECKVIVDRKGWSFSGKMNLGEMAFQEPKGEFVGEGIFLKVEFTGKGSEGRPAGIRYSTSAEKGEILLNRTYIDLNRNGFHFSGEAEVGLPSKRARSGFTLKLKDLLSFSGRAILELNKDPFLMLNVQVPETDIGPAFKQFVSEPYRREIPFLGGLNASGTFSADVELSIGSEWSLNSRCRIDQGLVSSKELSFLLKGIRLDLPLFLQTAKSEEKSEPGHLQIDSMELPLLPAQSLDVATSSGPNAIVSRGPIILKVPGGAVEVGPISATEFLTRLSIRTTLSMKELSLKPVLSGVWPRSVEGMVTGMLDPVIYSEGIVSTKGELKANLFGGEAVIEDPGVTGLFSFPVFSLDARWRDISLLELSRDTSFGQIEGVMRGRIKELEIAQMQPQRFDLLLETVPRKGVPQKISIDAVDNIARIGSGQSPFMGAAGLFSKFFKEFAYSRIGVKAILENDIFRINGTIHEGGVEYLVKRGSFSGVNVVNQNPDNRISFRDMLKRIQRIGSSGEAPVIR